MAFTHYNSGNNSEKVKTIPITDGNFQKRVIYSIDLNPLGLDDIVIALGEVSGTNQFRKGRNPNVMFVGQILLCDSPNSTVGSEITEANGFNITRNMNHGTIVKIGTKQIIQSDLSRNYLNFISYAGCTQAIKNDTLRINQDYGRLSAIKINNNMNIKHYNSGNASERVKSIPVAKTSNQIKKNVIFSIEITENLSIGDVLLVTSEYQATNDLGFNTSIVSQLILTNSQHATTGLEITEANGYNITPNMHHGYLVKNGTIEMTSRSINKKYVNLISFSKSNAAKPGDSLTIDNDYGRLSIIHFKN